jgi:hypothetical protein
MPSWSDDLPGRGLPTPEFPWWHEFIIVSYPKSGRTWLAYMLGMYAHGLRGEPLPDDPDVMAMAREHRLGWFHLGGIVKTPFYNMSYFERELLERARGAVLLTRNIYSTLTSYYYQIKHRMGLFDGTPSEMLRHPTFGVVKILGFYTAFQDQWRHVLRDVTVISYERLRENGCVEFSRVLDALRWEIRDGLVRDVVEASEFSRMRRLSETGAIDKDRLRPGVRGDERTYKVRRADPAEYLELFGEGDRAYIAAAVEVFRASGLLEPYKDLLSPPRVPERVG